MPDRGKSTRRPFDLATARRTVFQALADARREHGAGKIALVDGDDRTFTYDEVILASFRAGLRIKARHARGGLCGA
jgi:acyl-[acyl-carrier-protein]-phospholipid O-acyltransferase/long-chain-fatty-acid--[acyl-carrier-protein] ligase